jgi:hypothetical protein
MARVILGSYMARYPLGGVLSSSLQWLSGFQKLGHDVYLVEKAGWENSCYDPSRNVSSNVEEAQSSGCGAVTESGWFGTGQGLDNFKMLR